MIRREGESEIELQHESCVHLNTCSICYAIFLPLRSFSCALHRSDSTLWTIPIQAVRCLVFGQLISWFIFFEWKFFSFTSQITIQITGDLQEQSERWGELNGQGKREREGWLGRNFIDKILLQNHVTTAWRLATKLDDGDVVVQHKCPLRASHFTAFQPCQSASYIFYIFMQ